MVLAASGAGEFERFYEATAASIRAYILRHCWDRGAADDLFQITYVKFLKSRMGGTPLAPKARAYLYRIASNAIKDHGRKQNRLRRFESPVEDVPAAKSESHADESIALRSALRSLSKREQQLLWLLYAEGFSHKEVAGIMSVSSGSVRVLAFRARKKLAQRLASSPRTEKKARK